MKIISVKASWYPHGIKVQLSVGDEVLETLNFAIDEEFTCKAEIGIDKGDHVNVVYCHASDALRAMGWLGELDGRDYDKVSLPAVFARIASLQV